jgi:hypothetical protein
MQTGKPIDGNMVHEAATAFKKAVESLGAKNVVIIYSWSIEGKTYTGADYDTFLTALGLCAWAKHEIQFDRTEIEDETSDNTKAA